MKYLRLVSMALCGFLFVACQTAREHRLRVEEIRVLESHTAESVKFTSIAKDGGSITLDVLVDDGGVRSFYIDRSLETSTRGQVFNSYPGGGDSIMLRPGSPLSKSIRELNRIRETGRGDGR